MRKKFDGEKRFFLGLKPLLQPAYWRSHELSSGIGTQCASLIRSEGHVDLARRGSTAASSGLKTACFRRTLMKSSVSSPSASRWSLTRADLVLCALPIALFLSIVSLV
jgi:hypothetical protein